VSSGSACWILWLTPMDWLALSIGRSGSQPLEYSFKLCITMEMKKILFYNILFKFKILSNHFYRKEQTLYLSNIVSANMLEELKV